VTTPEEIQELASKKLQMKMGVRKELKRLPHHLNDGEQVINLSSGMYDGKQGLIVLTDQRVIFTSEGVGSSRLEDFPYSRISSVQTSTGMTFGELTIYVSGNKAQIKQLIKDRAPEIGDYIRGRISDSAGAPPQVAATPPPAPSSDPTDELRKFAALRDEGIISEDEFQAKKRQVLGLD
jgi:hypothetical protein